jgi:uncharacterized protein YdeI (BOF family)
MAFPIKAAVALALSAAAFCLHAAEYARDTESTVPGRPIGSVIAAPREGIDVRIEGRVQERRGPYSYIVADKTGSVYVRIAPTLLRGGVILVPGTQITVWGHVEVMPGGGVEVEARRVAVVHEGTAPGGDVLVR